jgi:mannose-6-phosphate isomerase
MQPQPLGADLGRWMTTAALPLWAAEGVDPATGAFQEALDQSARPTASPRRARVQARQIYVYCLAGEMGWRGPWRDIARRGLAAFRAHYRREDGLYRTLVAPDGAPLDDTAMVYDQAFVLFALAAAAKAMPDMAGQLRREAAGLLRALKTLRGHAAGGFAESVGPTPFQSNPHMHLLEAALAWREIAPADGWDELADSLVGLCLERFIDPRTGALHEFFDADWRLAEGEPGRVVEPGHQFEWAWLLERWARIRGCGRSSSAAHRLFDVGSRGVDPVRRVAVNLLEDDLNVRDGSARLWPQTEWLKASNILLGSSAGRLRDRYAEQVEAATHAVRKYIDTPVPGLWRDRLLASGEWVEEPAPASSFYHIACAITETLN